MKNLLFILIILLSFSACNSSSDGANNQERKIQLLTDSATYNNDLLSDTSTTVNSEKIVEKAPDKTKSPAVSSKQKNNVEPVTSSTTGRDSKPTPAPIATNKDSALNNSGTANTGTIDKSDAPASPSVPQPEEKKGWNKATQGAVIGGAVGAVGGAIISKKKGVGAVVGGIVGAAGGYIIGNKKDKKDKESEKK